MNDFISKMNYCKYNVYGKLFRPSETFSWCFYRWTFFSNTGLILFQTLQPRFTFVFMHVTFQALHLNFELIVVYITSIDIWLPFCRLPLLSNGFWLNRALCNSAFYRRILDSLHQHSKYRPRSRRHCLLLSSFLFVCLFVGLFVCLFVLVFVVVVVIFCCHLSAVQLFANHTCSRYWHGWTAIYKPTDTEIHIPMQTVMDLDYSCWLSGMAMRLFSLFLRETKSRMCQNGDMPWRITATGISYKAANMIDGPASYV